MQKLLYNLIFCTLSGCQFHSVVFIFSLNSLCFQKSAKIQWVGGRNCFNDEIQIITNKRVLVSLGMISESLENLLYHFVYLTILYLALFDFICAWQCIKLWDFYYSVKVFCLIETNAGLGTG